MRLPAQPFRSALRPLGWLALALSPLAAQATNGYFSNGYGEASQGAGGVGIALPQDGLVAAINPAGITAVGNRLDLGLTWFSPRRSADIVGNGAAPDASYSGDGARNFFLPDFAYTRQIDARWSGALAVYGNGGLNTDYAQSPFARFGATGSAGVNLEQLFISPTVAYRLNESHSLGLGLNLAYQRFSAKGLGFLSSFSQAPSQVSDQGDDSSTGAGLHLGWTGKVAPGLTLGATWASKISGRFSKYSGLFAHGGSFDIPENGGLGVAWEVTPALTLSSDYQVIRYSQVAAVGDSAASLFAGQPLGSSPGFGWRDAKVLKFGAVYKARPDLVLRAGASQSSQVVPASETFFNILAPGVIRTHLSLGATWTLPGGSEITGFYERGLGTTVNGSGSIPPSFGGGNANVRLAENILGVSYGWHF
ncbi:MAG: outer membrane protein transport protein [Curvibacter sp.]|nr:outer membrane protein transport protein [Curvibacter sp.]